MDLRIDELVKLINHFQWGMDAFLRAADKIPKSELTHEMLAAVRLARTTKFKADIIKRKLLGITKTKSVDVSGLLAQMRSDLTRIEEIWNGLPHEPDSVPPSIS